MSLPEIRGRVAFVFEEIDFDVDQINRKCHCVF